jgi:hypothetical protein
MSRARDLADFGRRVAAAQGMLDDRSERDWLAYGQACQDALAWRRPLPLPRPASAPPRPPVAARMAPVFPCLPPPPPAPAVAPRAAPAVAGPYGAPVHQVNRRRSFVSSIAWGLAWRYGILSALFIAAQSQAQAPWLLIAAVLLGGLLLGLWHRRWALARVWRTAVVAGGAVYVAPLFSVYPGVLVGSIGALTVAPVLATWRSR